MTACFAYWSDASNSWVAEHKGQVIARNGNKANGLDYLRRVIEGGLSKKAQAHGITRVLEVQGPTAEGRLVDVEAAQPTETVETLFGINERFDIMQDYVEMVANKQIASALCTGQGGLGKTFTVMQTLRECGLKNMTKMEIEERLSDESVGYVVVKGFSTAKGLYRTLYENKTRIMIFDDCDSILRDPTAANLLKAALDSYETRIITWNAESFGDDGLPRSFEFTGGVIFISNLNKEKVPQAIRSRAMCADVSMSRKEVVERMKVIATSDSFMPEFEMNAKMEAVEFIEQNAFHPLVKELNLRALVNTVKARVAKPDSWKRCSLYDMMNG